MNSSANDLNRLGIAHAQAREFRQAAECFRRAVAVDPLSANSLFNLGNALAELGEFPSAKACYEQALHLKPQSANLHCSLGLILSRMSDHAGAVASFQRAVELAPNHAIAHSYLGVELSHLDRYSEAIRAFQRVAQLTPGDAAAQINLGTTLIKAGNYDAALKSYETALRDLPNFPELHCNYAIALKQVGRFSEALAHCDAARQLKPDHHAALLLHATTRLLSGDYANGWREYECRIQDKSLVRFTHEAQRWDGSPLAGYTLLLEAEQGLGDTIQFVRYAHEIKRHHNGQIIVAVQPRLVALLAGIAGADVLIGQNEPRPPFNLWAPLLSLPGIMGHDPACFPATIPYLRADPGRVEQWKARLAQVERVKIGIAWQGSKHTRHRHFQLRALAPVAKTPGVTLISLQKGEGSDQLAGLTEFKVLTLGDDFDASGGAFLDSAAVMQNLDLVITADTAIGHLAGALGVPVWLALAFAPDWRWTMHGDRTSAYPTMRLFRQPSPGDWPSVFQNMATELSALARGVNHANLLHSKLET